MKVTVEETSPVQKKLSVEIPPEEVTKELDQAYQRLRKNVKVKGFRKGKVPISVLERMYSKEVEGEVMESLIQRTLPDAIKEADVVMVIEPILDSAGDIKRDSSFTYAVLLDIRPEFELPEYKGLEIVKPDVEVTDEEVEEQIEALRRHYGSVDAIIEDRPVEKGDIVVIDYTGFSNGEEVEGLKEEDYYLEVGAGYFNEDFENSLIGMERGEEREIEVTYPEDAINEKVAGKTITYKVKLKDIKERSLPALDDKFVESIGVGLKTVDELKKRLKDEIKKEKEEAVDRMVRQQILEQLRDKVDFPIPERLIENKLTQMLDNVASHLEERGMDYERAGISEDKLKEKMREDAIQQVKTEIILDKIAEKEGINVPEDEINQYLEAQARYPGIDPEQIQSAVFAHVIPKLRAKKTLDFLIENAVMKKPDDKSETNTEQTEDKAAEE